MIAILQDRYKSDFVPDWLVNQENLVLKSLQDQFKRLRALGDWAEALSALEVFLQREKKKDAYDDEIGLCPIWSKNRNALLMASAKKDADLDLVADVIAGVTNGDQGRSCFACRPCVVGHAGRHAGRHAGARQRRRRPQV